MLGTEDFAPLAGVDVGEVYGQSNAMGTRFKSVKLSKRRAPRRPFGRVAIGPLMATLGAEIR